MKRHLSSLALALGLVGAAGATSVLLLSENELIDGAATVIQGTVLSSESVPGPGILPVVTEISVLVEEVLKGGASDPVIKVLLPGGSLNGTAMQVAGTPSFQEGEEVCLFLSAATPRGYGLTGFAQSKYRLVRDPSSGLTVALRDHAPVHLVPDPSPGQTAQQALRSAAPMLDDWGEFRRRILDRVAGGTR